MDAQYKELRRVFQLGNVGDVDQGKLADYYYGTTEITRKLVQSEAFRIEYGLCQKELEVARWTNDEYLRLIDPYLEPTLRSNSFTDDDRTLYNMHRNRAEESNTVLDYLETVVPESASCISSSIDLTSDSRDHFVNEGGAQVSVKNLSPINVVTLDPYPSVNDGTIAAEVIAVRRTAVSGGRPVCTAAEYWENDDMGAPPSEQNPQFAAKYADRSIPSGTKDAIEADLTQRWNAYRAILKEKALAMYGNVC